MRRICLAVVPTLLVLTSCIQSGGTARGDASPSPPASSPVESSPDLPAPVPTCSLLVGAAEIGLTERQATTATDLAADVLEAGNTPRELVAVMARIPGAPLNGTRLSRTRAARALLGYDGPALSCLYGRVVLRDEPLGPSGLTARAERVRREIGRLFGDVPMGGFAAGGVSSGHVDNSSHFEGRAIDVFFRPYTDRFEARQGWVLAQWLVAHAQRLRILSVIYRDRIWAVWASFAGWRIYTHPGGVTSDPVLRHLDHVHTAVIGALHRDDP